MLNNKTKTIFLISIFLGILFFLVYHFRVFFFSSEVIIYDFEKKDSLIIEADKYIISGKAPNSKKFYINNKEILLDRDYNFSETLYLYDYQNTFFIKSISKTGPIYEREIMIFKES